MKNPSRLSVLATLVVLTLGSASATEPTEQPMQKVLGIGGLFFRSENPERLAMWYETHLGISLVPKSYGERPWHQEGGYTVFAPFDKNTKYFGKPEQAWMVNFRVADLEAMIAPLRGGRHHR
jgi:hypothetical protein